MMKKIKLADVPFGKDFEIWGHTYTVLDGDNKGVFVLETDSVCKMPFREYGADYDEVDYKVAPNDFRDSSVRAYLEGAYTEELARAGAKLDEDILPMEIDLKCTLGQREYGTAKLYAGLLTLEQYGKYYDIIPKIDMTCWLATPWKTPNRSPSTIDANHVWYVNYKDDCGIWGYYNDSGVRPTLTLNPSLLVFVECDEDKEEAESKWHKYLKYLIHWAIDNVDNMGSCADCYETWLDNERKNKE